MARKATLAYFRARGLLPFQAEFALRFVRDAEEPCRELVAPAGTGKTRIAAAIIAHTLEDDASKRILVLAPAPVLNQWHSELSTGLSLGTPCCAPLTVDRRTYFELESRVPVGETPWPIPAVILMSLEVAKRDDMAANLSKVTWDLVVVDESRLLTGSRKMLFDRLQDSGAVRRALLLTTVAPLLDGDLVTNIRYQDVVGWDRRPLFGEIDIERKLVPVYFSRTAEERVVLGRLWRLGRRLGSTGPCGIFQQGTILRAASSSIFTAEQTVRRLRDLSRPIRNEIMHEIPWTDEDVKRITRHLSLLTDDLESPDEPTDGTAFHLHDSRDFLEYYEELESLLDQIEEVSSDSKLDALLSHLMQGPGAKGQSHVCIWASFRNTVQYLTSNLRGVGVPVHSLSGTLPGAERLRRMEAFRQHGGILVTTDVVLTGATFAYVEQCINYDLPRSALEFEQRAGRFLRLGRETEFQMVVLLDETRGFQWEEEVLKSFEDWILPRKHAQQVDLGARRSRRSRKHL